jgi:hypothetical protein
LKLLTKVRTSGAQDTTLCYSVKSNDHLIGLSRVAALLQDAYTRVCLFTPDALIYGAALAAQPHTASQRTGFVSRLLVYILFSQLVHCTSSHCNCQRSDLQEYVLFVTAADMSNYAIYVRLLAVLTNALSEQLTFY